MSIQPRLTPIVDAVPHKRVRGSGARLRMLLLVVQDDRRMCPGYAAVEYVKVRCRYRLPLPSLPQRPERCSEGLPYGWSGETIDESIALRYRKYTFINHSTRTIDRDTCGLRISMFQNQGAHRARVPSPPVHAWMVLASDMRARSANDRLGPHAHGHCASVRGECAVGACRSRRWKRTVGREHRARSLHM